MMLRVCLRIFISILGLLLAAELLLRLAGFIVLVPQLRRNAWSEADESAVRILTLGESTTADAFARDDSWPRLLEKKLKMRGYKARVYNVARPSIGTSAIAEELSDALTKYRPQIVISMMGINDAGNLWLKGGVSDSFLGSLRVMKAMALLRGEEGGRSIESRLAGTRSNYRKVADLLRASGVAFIAMQYPRLDVEKLRDHFRDQPTRAVAAQFNEIVFLSNQEKFESVLRERGWDALFIDRFAESFGHATELGNDLLAETALTGVLKVISERSLAEPGT